MILILLWLLGVVFGSAKWRKNANEFCARLPVDPHCPLLHTLNDIFLKYSTKSVFRSSRTKEQVKTVFNRFCDACKGKPVTLEVFEDAGGQVKMKKHQFCLQLDDKWTEEFLYLFLEDVKLSSVTGYYGTDVAEYLKELLEVSFASNANSLDLKFRLLRANWLLKEARKVISVGPIRREEDGVWQNVLFSIAFTTLFFLIFTGWLFRRRQQ